MAECHSKRYFGIFSRNNIIPWLEIGVGVNRSFAQVLGVQFFSNVFLYKKTKLKWIFWFFSFTWFAPKKNSQTRHSEWQKVIIFFGNPIIWPLILLQMLCWVRICRWKIVNLIIATKSPWALMVPYKMPFSKKIPPFWQF